MRGMTSVTFRNLPAGEIVALVAQCGLEGIEWGADRHVPPGAIAAAEQARNLTEAAGLRVLSYGSYFYAGECEDVQRDFSAIIESAQTLGAPVIRVWAGRQSSADAHPDYRKHVVSQLRLACTMAKQKGITVALEHHRNTLTDRAESAKALLHELDAEGLRTYWQPNPDLSLQQQLQEILLLRDKIISIHVFAWEKGDIRRPLQAFEPQWRQYIKSMGKRSCNYIMEFVKDDAPENFAGDAKTLLSLTNG